MYFLRIAKNKKSAETTPSTTTPAAPAVEYKTELNIAINANPLSLDVPAVNSNIVGGIGMHIFEPLFSLNAYSQPTAVLADSYTISADGKVYTIKLRQGVKFHNGAEMKADDVVASMTLWLEKSGKAKALLNAARSSLGVGVSVSLMSCVIGTFIGIYASYFKILDMILMRICEGLTAIPGVLLAIALMAALGASNTNVIIALTIVYTPSVARVVRSSALVTKGQLYVEAAKVQGASSGRILWTLILPNVISPLTVQASYIFAQAIISEASLSFLGAGIPAPAASWGNILQASKGVLQKAPWTVIFPGAAVILCVLSLNLLGDGLRDYLDPRTA